MYYIFLSELIFDDVWAGNTSLYMEPIKSPWDKQSEIIEDHTSLYTKTLYGKYNVSYNSFIYYYPLDIIDLTCYWVCHSSMYEKLLEYICTLLLVDRHMRLFTESFKRAMGWIICMPCIYFMGISLIYTNTLLQILIIFLFY